MAQIVEIFLWVRKVPIHAVNTIVADNLAIQGARLSVALYGFVCSEYSGFSTTRVLTVMIYFSSGAFFFIEW